MGEGQSILSGKQYKRLICASLGSQGLQVVFKMASLFFFFSNNFRHLYFYKEKKVLQVAFKSCHNFKQYLIGILTEEQSR